MSDTITLDVGGMTCEGCASRVRDALQAVSGVASADVSHEQGTAVISLGPSGQSATQSTV